MGVAVGSRDGISSQSNQVRLPDIWAKEATFDNNQVAQLILRSQQAEVVERDGTVETLRTEDGDSVNVVNSRDEARAARLAVILSEAATSRIDRLTDLSEAVWSVADERDTPAEVLASFEDAFDFAASAKDGGLRPPQRGALHSVLGYWTTRTDRPATVVMPTGTGKTETMVALLVAAKIPRLMVLVPTASLRDQISRKFAELGVLKRIGVVTPNARFPVVGRIEHGFATAEAAKEFVDACNVIVTTPHALDAAANDEVRQTVLDGCTHLFVDEAHHVAAPTWNRIRQAFEDKLTVQFTATPFREDGEHIGGRMAYEYPLSLAQREGYFSEIDYYSVLNLKDPDRAIARRAVQRLQEDLENDLDHILMARVKQIDRAHEVVEVYREIAPELKPVEVHSRKTTSEQADVLESIRNRDSRIVVCVNMLGEGFDLPALKIAAIHDTHKSLGVTLQFIGRFARTTGGQLGNAAVVVGRPARNFDPELRRLYAQDADWNEVITDLSEDVIEEQREISDFEDGFGAMPSEVTMRSLLPRMSTVVYRSTQEWDPLGILDVYSDDELLTHPIAINQRDMVAWFVTEVRSSVRWGDIEAVEEISYELYVLYRDDRNDLLFINSSNTDSHHERLAKAVVGESAERITGETVYRAMSGLDRLVPTNVGLLDYRNRSRRFSMHVGADVVEGFPASEAATKTKTNIFAVGFERGERTTVGASLKGRIWSYRVANSIKEWVDWCDHIGAKLLNDQLDVDAIMARFIRPEVLNDRPNLVPLALEWTWEFYAVGGESLVLHVEGDPGERVSLIDVEFAIRDHSPDGPIRFSVLTPNHSIDYSMNFEEGEQVVTSDGALNATVVSPRRDPQPLDAFLSGRGLYVHFEQEALARPDGILLRPDRELDPYPREDLIAISWEDIDLTTESQGQACREDSIQYRMIEYHKEQERWDVVIDDDGTGEVADIVCLAAVDDHLWVQLTHCKWVAGGQPRAQVVDLYDVCGQAQKSCKWRQDYQRLSTGCFPESGSVSSADHDQGS